MNNIMCPLTNLFETSPMSNETGKKLTKTRQVSRNEKTHALSIFIDLISNIFLLHFEICNLAIKIQGKCKHDILYRIIICYIIIILKYDCTAKTFT